MTRVLALLVLSTWACAKHPTATECDAMLDRSLDMTEDDDPALMGMTGEPRVGVRTERIATRRASMAYVSAESRCKTEVSHAEHACAMKAPSANDWEACFNP
jgi:hypothetical protein